MRILTVFFFLLFAVGAVTAQTDTPDTRGDVLTDIKQMPSFIVDCQEGEGFKQCPDSSMRNLFMAMKNRWIVPNRLTTNSFRWMELSGRTSWYR